MTSHGPTWVLLNWTAPYNAISISRYEVAYLQSTSCDIGEFDETDLRVVNKTIATGTQYANITGLKLSMCYVLSVRAHSMGGAGEWSTILATSGCIVHVMSEYFCFEWPDN